MKVTLLARPAFIDPGDLNPRHDQLEGTPAEKIIEVAGRVCYDSFSKGRNSADYHQHILDVDHGCYDAETDVLTSAGWKNWPDVEECDLLATRTVEGAIEYHLPTKLVRYSHRGRMYRVDSTQVDLLVTPEHRMLVCPTTTKEGRRRERFSLMVVEDLGHKPHAYIKSGEWRSGEVSSPTDRAMLSLLGFAIGDGHMPERGFSLRFRLRRERKILWLRDVAARLGWGMHERDNDTFVVPVPEPYVPLFRSIYDDEREKQIPDGMLLKWDRPALECLLQGLLQSDGHVGETAISFDSTSQRLVGQVQQLALHVGLAANIGYTVSQEDRDSYGSRPLTRLHLVRRNLRPEVNRFVGMEGKTCWVDDWEGEVFCAEVPNHTLYVRRGGKPVWSGNSVLEHAYFVFRIEGISRALSHELVRHRVGVAISQRSTRYVDENESRILEHPALTAFFADDDTASEADKAGVRDVILHAVMASQHAYVLVTGAVERFLARKGTDKLTARKQARGAARFYLGNGLETEMVWSANVRALRHIIRMRGSKAADAEIRQLSVLLLQCVEREVPAYFNDIDTKPSPDGIGDTTDED